MTQTEFSTHVFYARHIASGKIRRVNLVRQMADGALVYQFAQVIKHEGQTIYHADARECWS